MATTVKKTISLPTDLARETEEIARTEGKSFNAVVQDALLLARRQRLTRELREIRSYWSGRARAKGILSDKDLDRLLAK